MNWIYMIGLAFALAMDAFAVSIATGIEVKNPNIGQVFRVSFWFGFFQFIMPLMGYFAGVRVVNLVKEYDHYIAFILLCFIGGHMIYDSFFGKSDIGSEKATKDPTSGITIIIRAIAVSIDALAAGVAFTAIHSEGIFVVSLLIGFVTAVMSFGGMKFGAKIGNKFGHYIEVLGGLILIGIGTKILIEHCFFGV